MKQSNINTNDIINNLYGFDNDELAVLLAKINIYILDKNIDFDSINIYKKDFLLDDIKTTFDIVIGNPPWGKKYNLEEKKKLQMAYDLAFTKLDSFSQFILRSFLIMNDNAILDFVLPSSILNIAAHQKTREFLLNYKIESIENIGREFDEIVTDVVIVKVMNKKVDKNICLYDGISIEQSFFNTTPYHNFLIFDNLSLSIIEKIKNYPSFHLNKNVEYALGIVTGNNKDYLLDTQIKNSEPIISGKELDKYFIDYSKIKKFILFDKDNLQQVAREDFYRNPNKIIYKFIGKKLCFAVENRGILSLNSANIICLSDDYDLYYISAILNSRITQLYFEDMYNTHKVLKNHIQSFYIPDFDDAIKNKISLISKTLLPQSTYCEDIENIIYEKLNLSNAEIEYIKNRFN